VTLSKTARNIETELRGLDYSQIWQALKRVSVETLIQLLDSRSIRIGDSAAGLLSTDQAVSDLISAVRNNQISTQLGKIRASNVLSIFGRRFPEALEAYLVLLRDRNDEAAANTLLQLVFWGDKRVIPLIEERKKTIKSPDVIKDFERAVQALGKSDTFIFSPCFRDADGIWK
jgi:hypothetical protein